MDDMTPVPVVLPAHTMDDLLRMCANVESDYGYQPVFIRVIRDRVAEAVERVKTLEAIAKDYGPDLVEHVLKRDGLQCQTMPSQRPCGSAGCMRPECRTGITLDTPKRPVERTVTLTEDELDLVLSGLSHADSWAVTWTDMREAQDLADKLS